MAFRLGAIIPTLTDGTSFYRAAGPLQALELARPEFRMESGGVINWVYLRGVSAVFLQRPFTPDHVRIVSMAKLHGKPVWVDYDDDLFTVPMSNPTHKVYSDKQNHNQIMTILTQADVVSVSTEALAEKFRKILAQIESAGERNQGVPYQNLNPDKIVVVPNAYDEQLHRYSFKHWQEPVGHATMTVMWRGSHTHDADLAMYEKAITNAFVKHGKLWTLNFVGSPFWQSIQNMEAAGIPPSQLVVTQVLDVIEYMQFIHTVKPAVMIVPLVDDLFNRAKSNIAWIEATHAGAMTLAPDWPEWRRPGVINYKDQEDFEIQLSVILRGDADRNTRVQASRDYIAEHLTLTAQNEQRIKIMERLSSVEVWA